MNAKRLLKLAEFLEKLPRNKFNYERFSGFVRANENEPKSPKGRVSLKECKTTACALGWVSETSWGKRLGVYLKDGEVRLKTTRRTNFEVGSYIFDLTLAESAFLFRPNEVSDVTLDLSPCENATPKQVAEHIRRFVKERTYDY